MVTERLSLLEGETQTKAMEYFFVATDDFSREIFTAIMPDKSSLSLPSDSWIKIWWTAIGMIQYNRSFI